MNVEVNIIDESGNRVWGSIFQAEFEENDIGQETLLIDFDEEVHLEEGDLMEVRYLVNG